MSKPEILPPAIEAVCTKLKKAADVYCQEYGRHSPMPPMHAEFDRATRTYELRKRQFNNAVQEWLKVHSGLPDWAKETLAYQTERGFLDPLWKAEGWVNV